MNKGSVMAAVAGMCGSMGAVSGKLAFDSHLGSFAKFSCVAVFIVSNVVMWATYTRSLALSDCTSTPMIVNIACNIALTGVLGSFLFSWPGLAWWLLLALLRAPAKNNLSTNKEEEEVSGRCRHFADCKETNGSPKATRTQEEVVIRHNAEVVDEEADNERTSETIEQQRVPFVPLSTDDPAIDLGVSPENIVAFHGFDSVFTTQHNFPVLIENKIYTSCDHYYQICKVADLTGISSDKLNCGVRDENGKTLAESTGSDKDKRAFSSIAKNIIKASNISKEKVDEWRHTKGLEAIQKALHTKLTQSAHLREALKESHDQILVHAFHRDSIYGTGCGVPQIKKWLEDLSKAGVPSLKIPATFPLNETTIQHCPVFAHGRNVLGVILMQLREKLRKHEVEVVDMTAIYTALRVNESPVVEMETNTVFTMDNKVIGTF